MEIPEFSIILDEISNIKNMVAADKAEKDRRPVSIQAATFSYA